MTAIIVEPARAVQRAKTASEQKFITVAFDVDRTLVKAGDNNTDHVRARETVRSTLIFFAKCKNTIVHVWSGNGEDHARNVVGQLGLVDYVDSYGEKGTKVKKDGTVVQTNKGFEPDIAIDDMVNTDLGHFNIIVGDETAE